MMGGDTIRGSQRPTEARRLLIVDDDHDFADSIKDVFEGLDYAVMTANSYEEALEVARAFVPHVAIIDVKLGRTSGIDLLPPLRASCPDVQCVMMTGYAAMDTVIESFRRAAVDYLHKPADLAALRSTVEKCVTTAKLRHEREEALDALQRSEQRYRRLVESLRDEYFFYASDASRRLTYVSPSVKNVLGYEPCSLDELWRSSSDGPPDAAALASHQSILDGRASPGYEVSALHADGGLRRLHFVESVVLDDAGAIVGVDGMAHDITERVENQERFRRLADATREAIVVHDGHRVLEANAAFFTLFGHAPSMLADLDVRALWSAESRAAYFDKVESRESVETELIAVKLDGERFPAAVRVGTIPHHGRTVCVTAVLDLTERRRAEEKQRQIEAQVRHSQKMEAIGLLTGGIAHDFNNVLQSIMGYAGIATRRVREGRHDAIQECLQQIHIASEGAKDLVAQLLLYSRGGKAESKPIAVEPIVSQTLSLLRPGLPRSVALIAEIEQDAFIRMDPTQLQQVLMNLCINARDALPETGGRIVVRLAQVEVTAECASCGVTFSGPRIEISVADDGVGMDERLIRKIFDPFFTTKEIGKGTGMGLAVTHGVAHEHGAHFLVTSTVGQGTTFRLLFPPVEHPATAARKSEAPKAGVPQAAQGKVMVVDDEPMIASYLAALLSDAGYRVTTFHDPREALARFAVDPSAWDLVITDQTMPGIAGDRLARSMIERRPDLPVILCSGYAEGMDAARAGSLQIGAFLEKPCKAEVVIEAVGRLIDGAANPGPEVSPGAS